MSRFFYVKILKIELHKVILIKTISIGNATDSAL